MVLSVFWGDNASKHTSLRAHPVRASTARSTDGCSKGTDAKRNKPREGARIATYVMMVARERFELSSAGPKPAMLVHYSRRKCVYFPPPGCSGLLTMGFVFKSIDEMLLINLRLNLVRA